METLLEESGIVAGILTSLNNDLVATKKVNLPSSLSESQCQTTGPE
jgi:hypothetical protein